VGEVLGRGKGGEGDEQGETQKFYGRHGLLVGRTSWELMGLIVNDE
jgi:hypothetical protein